MKLFANMMHLLLPPSHRSCKHPGPEDCEMCTWQTQVRQLAATYWPGVLQVAASATLLSDP